MQQYYKPTSTLFAWSSEYPESELRNFTKYYTKECQFLDSYISDFPLRELYPIYFKYISNFQLKIQNNKSFLSPIEQQIVNTRRLQGVHVSCDDLEFFKARIYQYYHTPENQTVDPIAHVNPELQKHLSLHIMKFAPCLAMIKSSATYYSNFVPIRKHVKVLCLSELRHQLSSPIHVNQAQYASAYPTIFKCKYLFEAQNEPEKKEININELKKQLRLFIAKKPNSLKYEIINLSRAPPEKYHNAVQSFYSIITNHLDRLPDVMRLLDECAPHAGASLHRVQQMYESCYDRNRHRHVQNNRQRLRDYKMSAQGLFGIDLRLPPAVNDTFARLTRMDDNGTFTHLMEMINQFQKNFEEATKPLRENPAKMETVSRTLIAFLMFMIVCFTVQDNLARLFAGLFVLNSLPRTYVNNFVASVYDTISSIADSYKVQTPEEAEQFLQDHGVLPPNDNRYNLTAQGDKDSSKENLIESFGKYLFTLFIDKDVTEIKLEDLRVKRITNLSRIMSSSKTILEFLESLILNLRDIVSDLFFGTENYHDAYRAIDVRIPAWITEVEKLEFLVNDSGKICSPLLALSQYEQKVRLVNLLREGDDLFKLVSAMYVKPEKIVRFLELKLNRVKDLVKGISATLVGMKSKHEPFSIYIWGKPGIGKSLMVDFILKDLYAANDEEYDFVRDKYMKSDITPFWEGYDHQKVYVIDDIFQTISEEIRTTQMNEVMHIGSRCPFPLNMADCANKGCVNFSSETLVVTANNKISSNEVEKVITTYEAFKRRFKFFIEAKLKPDYIDQNNRFNINLAAGDTFVRNAYQFTVETHQTTNTYDWDELIFLLADVRIEHVARQRELDLTLENSKSSTRAKYILHRQKKYGEKPQELPPKVDVEPQLMNNYLNLFPTNSTAEMKNTIVSFFQSDDRKAEGFLEYAFIRGFSQAANYLVNGFVRNSIFSFNLHPHLNINSETPIKIIEREKYRWAADPTTLAYKFGAPTQVRKGDVSYTQEISDLVDIEKMKVEANMKIQPNQSPQQFSVDVQLLSEFFAGLHTERRMVFNLREFQMVYEGIRAASTEQNHRFSTDQYAMICLERSDLGLIRAWLTSPNVNLDVERLETDYGKFLYKEIIDRLRSMSHMVPIDCEVKTFRSTVKAYLTHPVFVALGIATTVFSAYHLYSHFQKTNTPLQPFPTSWRDFTSEAGASTSGDSVTRRPRRMAFKKHTRYAENRPNKPTASTPHPHQCPQCLRYYAHFHAFDHVKTHNHVPFVCPYSDCNDFYLLNPDRANDNPPYRCFAVNESEVEFIDEPLFKDPLLSEAERDPQCMVAMQILNDHVVTVHVVGSGTMRGIIVAGRTMIMPYHAFHCLDMIDNAEIVIEGRLLPQFTMTLTAENYIVDRKKDIIMFNLPDKIPLKKNVIDYFCNEKEYLNQIDSAYVIKYMGKNTSLYQHITDLRMDKEIDYKVINAKDEREQWYVPHGYVYTADTGPGDCGSPIVVCHKGMTRKVLGMHVAGGKGTGALALVTPEQLRDMQNRLNERSAQFSKEEISREYCEDFFDCVDFPLHPQDNIEILGLIPNSKIVYQPSTTAILPSALNNEIFPCATQPALLCRKGKLDPLRNDLIKQCTKEVLFNEEYLNLAVTDLSNTINSLKSPYKNRKQLNLHENVNGIDGDDYICSLNFQSSVGFPWPQKLKKLGSKKERYFTGEIGNKVPLPQITQALEEMEEKCSKRIVPFVMFHDSLKDERRPLAKVLAGKTRIFSVPPVEFTLLVRKHFLNFVAHLMHNHITSEVSVGLNVHSDEWKIFFEHAKSVGHNWIAGDYGGYDKRLPYQVCMAALRVVDEFYADQCGVIRRSLGEAMFSSVHFANRVVYQTHHGMPSGVPITAVFNSVVNSLLFRLAFIEISVQAGKSLPETLGFLREGIAIRTYGDDHLVRVHRDCDYFNMVTVSKYFESKGLEYTTTTKAEVEEKYVAEEDLSYLKRKFVYRNGICCAPLEMQSIQEMINWIRKCDDPILALEQNIEAALLEMTHYSRKEWNYFYNRLRDACRTKSIALKTYSFDLCQQILRSGDTANYGVILLEDQTLQVKSTAAIGSEPSRTFLGPTNTGNGSLNIGCKVSEAKVDRSPSVSSVAKNQILKSKYNLIAQSAHETDENIHMTFMGSVSEIPKYSTEDGEFPQGMNLRFEYLARNSYCTFYRLIKITNCTTTPVGQSQSNLTWCGLTFVKEFEDNLSEVYSLNRCQYIPPPECSLYFKRDTGYEELSVFSMYVMPPSEFTTGYDEGGEGPNFMFTYSYTLGDQNVFYLSKRLFPTLLPKQSIIFIPQYHTNSYGWYTFRINELMTFDNIDDIIYHNDTEHDQGISEDKISPDKIPSFKTTVDDIFFHYAFTQGEQEVELVDLLTLKPPLKEMLAVFTYDSETPTRFYYRLNFVSKASPLGEFYSNAPQVDKIYDELEDITPTDDEVNDFNERLLKLSISRAEKLSYDDSEGLQLQNIVDDSELLEEPSERKINYQALVDAGTSSSPQKYNMHAQMQSEESDLDDQPPIKKIRFNFHAQSQLNAETEDIVTETQVITKFMDAADQNEVTVASRQSGLKKLNPYPHPTLESFWERPYPIAQETWTPSSKKIIHYISLPNDLFKIDPLWDKIRNFRFCNFDLEVSVRVNGTPFHYGQLMFAVIPNAMNGILGAKGRNNNFGPWENYYSLSGFEHILVSPTENQVQKLKIPYVLPKPFIDLEDLVSNSEVRRHIEFLESEIAGIAVVPLAPLNSMGTPTNVSFTVFARIVNPVFTGFCSVLDANNRYSNFKRDIYVPRNEGFGDLDMWVSTQIPVAPYSSGDSHIEPPPHMPYNFTAEFKADKEAVKKAENNCISDVLESAVSTVASIGLKALGTELGLFSMPNDVSGVVNIANKFPNLSNTHGTSAGYGMGIIPDNKVLPAASLLGSSAETMKITNIISRRALVCQFPIKSSHIDGDRIANLPVTPMLCHGKTAEVNKVPLCRIFHTPLSYVAKCFTYWRGDVIFHFDFICSNFHNARVRIGWIPKVSTQTRVGSIDESNYHNMIIDLASQTKVDFRVPYLNDEPFLDTRPSSWNGIVFVSLINAISYPNPTIPDIKVNVWISGADNFKFGMPIKSGTRRFVKQEGACAKSYGIRAYAAYNMEAQSGPENTQDTIIPAEEAYYNGFMFGEDVQHIKELCMRPYLTYSRRVAEKVAIGLEYLQNPWVVDTHTVCDQVDAVRTDTIGGFFSYFKMLFRFWRSSFTQRVYSDMKTEMLLSAVMTTSDGNYSDKIWASWDTASDSFRPMVDFVGNGTQLIRDIHNQVPSFHIPFYYNKPFVPSSAEYAGCPTYLDSSPSIYYKWFTGTVGTEDIVHHYIMTNPSDDLEFGYQIGAPCEFMDSYDWNRRYPLIHSTIWRDDDPYFD